MSATPLHAAAGESASDITFDLVRRAVEARAEEGQRLDFKRDLPEQKGLGRSDLPKDVAAFANAEGGMLVYGVTDVSSAADHLSGVTHFDDNFERSVRQAVQQNIFPPVHNVVIRRLEDASGVIVVTIEVPRSNDAPHSISALVEGGYRTPLRVGRDTRWVTEPEVAAAYRRRFSARLETERALDDMYDRAYDIGRRSGGAWFVGVARPVVAPWSQPRRGRDRARELIDAARANVENSTSHDYYGALRDVAENVRPALRGWTARSNGLAAWREAYVSVYDDGSVAVSASLGGHRNPSGETDPPHDIEAVFVESAVADLGALLNTLGAEVGIEEYDVRVGIEYAAQDSPEVQVWDRDTSGHRRDTGVRVPRFTPVRGSVTMAEDLASQIADIALDLVHQGGVSVLKVVQPDEPWT